MNDISFIILHYNDAKLTQKYIENLQGLKTNGINFHIIVVDNASPDGSGKILYNLFFSVANIDVLLNDVNLGFAKGNNVGLLYAKKKYDSDLYVVSNNDIEIENTNFLLDLLNIYDETQPAVIGPDIYSLSKNIHQSPIRLEPLNLYELEKLNKDIDRKIKLLKIIKATHTYALISNLKRCFGKKPGKEGVRYRERQKNVVLQGAFFVLARKYVDLYPDGLYEKTFLYLEEDILAYLCKEKGLETIYEPSLKVIHYDGYSTKKIQKNRCNKYIFELTETKNSANIMIDLIKDV